MKTVSEVEKQSSVSSATIKAKKSPQTGHKAKLTPTGHIRIRGGTSAKSQKKDNSSNSDVNMSYAQGKDVNVVNEHGKVMKSSKSSFRAVKTPVTTLPNIKGIPGKETRKKTETRPEKPETKFHRTKKRPLSSKSISKREPNASSEANTLETEKEVLPTQISAPFSIRNAAASDIVRSRSENTKRSYRKNGHRLYRRYSEYQDTVSSNQQRSYPRPHQELYSSESDETVGDKCGDISDLSHDNDLSYVEKDVSSVKKKGRVFQKIKRNKKKHNRIRPKNSNFRHEHRVQLQTKPFSYLHKDIKVLLGKISNYGGNRDMHLAGRDQRLVRYKALNDLSRIKKGRKKSRKKIAPVHHDMSFRDRENSMISVEDEENDCSSVSVVNHLSAQRSKQKAQVESLRTALEAILDSSK